MLDSDNFADMISQRLKIILFVFLGIFCGVAKSSAQGLQNEQYIEVSMRMIGHYTLLNSGDRISRVLPIQKEGSRYHIQFESHFEFYPSDLVTTIDSIVQVTKIANSYFVEVENCETNEIVHSYSMGAQSNTEMTPCGPRRQPLGCYSLFITILELGDFTVDMSDSSMVISSIGNQPNYLLIAVLLIVLVSFIVGGIYFLRKKQKPELADHIIAIGEYQFDQRNMKLSFENNKTELTSKEADLLFLLHSSANTTLERDVILNKVWGDEGDYVGRTLDVFISKLRKKLGADPSVQIANIRGVGYKLVLNNVE